MNNNDKTKEQLLQELSALKLQIEKLKRSKKEDCGHGVSPEETEALFREAIEHSNDGVIILSGDERLYCNRKYLEILGYDNHEEISGMPLFSIVQPADRKAVAEYARRRQKGDEVPSSYECRLVKKDGSMAYAAISASNITYKGRSASLGFVRDITEQKKIQEALRLSESNLRTILDSVNDAIFIHGIDGRIVDVNNKMLEMYRVGMKEACSMSIARDFSAPDNPIDELPEIWDNVMNGEKKVFEWKARRPHDGSFFDVEVFLRRITLYSTDFILASIHDITTRKSAEEELRASEKEYRSVIENIQDVFYRSNADGFLLMGSPSGARMFGYDSVEEMIGLPLDIFWVDPGGRRQFIDRIKESGSVKDFEALLKKRDGTIFNASFTTQFYYDEESNFLGTEGIIRDITERKLLESQLLDARKMEAIGTLAGGIAHDFNNLLMGIQGYTSLMLYNMELTDPHYQRLKNIEEIVRNGSDLTSQLLGFARGGKYEVRPVDINDLIARTAEMFGRTRKEIAVHKKLADDLPRVEVDQGQIEQVLVNLYLNAWQAMPGGGDLYLKTRSVFFDKSHTMRYSARPGKYVKIVISDTGVGMDDTVQKRIFEPFFTTKEMGRGSGLGLASAYGVIKNHGGMIEVSSEKGRGTAFTIHLPVAGKTVSVEEEGAVSPWKGSGTVLIVDDQEMLLETSSEMLRILGYNVLVADDGQKAVDLFSARAGAIDIVILDMIMPGLSGAATYDRLRRIDPGVKVILSSGYSLDGEAARILERGCNGFIQKPFGLETLSKKIREVLEGT